MLNLTIVKIETTPEGGTQITTEVSDYPILIYDNDSEDVKESKSIQRGENAKMMRLLHLGFAQLTQVGD